MVFYHPPYWPFFCVDARIRCPRYRVPLQSVRLFFWIYFATISGLSLSFPLPRCGCLYWVEIFRNGVTLCHLLRASCFTSANLWSVYCFEYSSAAPYVHTASSPPYTNALILKRRLNRRWVSSVYYPDWVCLYPLLDSARVRVFNMIDQEYPC